MLDFLKRWLSPRKPSRKENDAAFLTDDAARPLPLDAQLAIANGLATEMHVRESLRQYRRKMREAAGNNPLSIWAASLVDPYSWVNDTPDFYPGFGDIGFGVSPFLNNQLRGDVLPVFINEMGLKLIRDWSRRTLAYNEFAINAVENRISYIIGKGYQYAIVPKQKRVTEQPIGGGGGMAANELAAKAQAVLDEFIDRERWNEREQECIRRCDRDGEAILRFFRVGQGRTAVRFVEPETLTDQSGETHRMYGVVTDPEDIEGVTAYSIVANPNAGWRAEDVPAGEVLHIKANTDFDAKRGLPTLFPVRKNLERAEKLLRNMSVMAQVQATFAVLRKHKKFGPSSVSAYQQAQSDLNVQVPVSGRSLQIQQLFPGSVIDTSENTEYEFPSANVNAAGLVAVLQAELRAVAARLVMPEYMLTIDASNANYASTMVAEAPAVKNFERLQHLFARRFGDGEYGHGNTTGAMWRVLANAVDAGVLPRETLTDLEIQVEAPSLAARNKWQETARAKTLAENGILSDATWAKWEGLDYEQEQKQGAKKTEKALSPGMGGFGAPSASAPGAPGGGHGPRTPSPPGSGEGAFAEAILREDEGRWVTIGGKSVDGKRRGGSPVFIKDGRIVKGAPSLTGRKLDAMKDAPADSTHRKELNQGKDYDRAKWGKKAKKEGIDPQHLHALADEMQAHDREHVERRKRLLSDARRMLKANGYDSAALTTNLRSGRVEDKIPHFDEVHEKIAKDYPDQFADYDDSEARLKDLLTEGNPEVMAREEAYERALEELRRMRAASGDDPHAFDFGFNSDDPIPD